MRLNKTYILLILVIYCLLGINFANGDNEINNSGNLVVNEKKFIISPNDVINTFTADFSDDYSIFLLPGTLKATTTLILSEVTDSMTIPWQVDLASKIFQYDFKDINAVSSTFRIYFHIKYNKKIDNLYQLYFYDKNKNSWRPLQTKNHPEGSYVSATAHLPFSRIAVFANNQILAQGSASWYKFKGGDFAASPDFPKGSRIRVYALNPFPNKMPFIDVTINDYGPDRNILPKTVIDLDRIAYAKLAPLGTGKINIRIEPLFIANDKIGRKTFADLAAISQPQINSKVAILINEDTNEIILEKNSTSTLPLASLTKLVAIKIFLDTRPTLNQVVFYSINDENYNYKYVDYKWEAAILKVKNGDKLTIENLLYSALVGSANNAVETLVRVSGLKRENFINNMNINVHNWGASSTKFIEPTGLSPANVSSARDYAIITKEVFKNPIIKKVSIMPQYTFTTINTKKKHIINNTNYLISGGSNLKITGSKTGYLVEAGYCLMSRAENNKLNLISVIFGAKSRNESFIEAENLLNYGFKNQL